MIKTKSIYHDPREPEDGYRILVMRHWPRGVRKEQVDFWLKDLGPSAGLLSNYRQGQVDWPTFTHRYLAEMVGTERGRTLMEKVDLLEREHGTLTLLCHEDLTVPDAHCHRELLKELLADPEARKGEY